MSSTVSNPNKFTMLFLDFDDTIIPSRLYRLFANDFGIDIFQLLSQTKMKQLQNTIINTLQYFQRKYISNTDQIYISVISNASQKWLNYMLKGSKQHNVPSRLPILDKYLEENAIPVISASAKAYEFVQKQFPGKADKIFSNTLKKENKVNKWMWKYTAFSSVINDIKQKTKAKCKRIISIGDGNDEEKACKHYTKTHKVESLHIRLLRGSTIKQLQSQWVYLKDNLYKTILIDDSINVHKKIYPFIHSLCDFRKLDAFKCDNNINCTGRTHQLLAITTYFQLWMNNLTAEVTAEQKKATVEIVCGAIHKKIYNLDAKSASSRNFKLILIKAVCKNNEFNSIFNAYYRKLQRQSVKTNKLKKQRKASSKRIITS